MTEIVKTEYQTERHLVESIGAVLSNNRTDENGNAYDKVGKVVKTQDTEHALSSPSLNSGEVCVLGSHLREEASGGLSQCACSMETQHRVARGQRHYPRPGSVSGRILGALLRSESLTQQDSLRRFSELRLAARIEALRKNGWGIHTELIKVATKDAGRRAEVAKYTMLASEIEAAGDEGREYAERCAKIEQEGA